MQLYSIVMFLVRLQFTAGFSSSDIFVPYAFTPPLMTIDSMMYLPFFNIQLGKGSCYFGTLLILFILTSCVRVWPCIFLFHKTKSYLHSHKFTYFHATYMENNHATSAAPACSGSAQLPGLCNSCN